MFPFYLQSSPPPEEEQTQAQAQANRDAEARVRENVTRAAVRTSASPFLFAFKMMWWFYLSLLVLLIVFCIIALAIEWRQMLKGGWYVRLYIGAGIVYLSLWCTCLVFYKINKLPINPILDMLGYVQMEMDIQREAQQQRTQHTRGAQAGTTTATTTTFIIDPGPGQRQQILVVERTVPIAPTGGVETSMQPSAESPTPQASAAINAPTTEQRPIGVGRRGGRRNRRLETLSSFLERPLTKFIHFLYKFARLLYFNLLLSSIVVLSGCPACKIKCPWMYYVTLTLNFYYFMIIVKPLLLFFLSLISTPLLIMLTGRMRPWIGMEEGVDAEGGPRRGATPETIDSLPVYKYFVDPNHEYKIRPPVGVTTSPSITNVKIAHDDAKCSICLGKYREGEELRILPICKHHFHRECVDEWFRISGTCPLCVRPLSGQNEADGDEEEELEDEEILPGSFIEDRADGARSADQMV